MQARAQVKILHFEGLGPFNSIDRLVDRGEFGGPSEVYFARAALCGALLHGLELYDAADVVCSNGFDLKNFERGGLNVSYESVQGLQTIIRGFGMHAECSELNGGTGINYIVSCEDGMVWDTQLDLPNK